MKTVTILSLLLLTSPAFGELTKEDLRTILKEEVRPIIKEEIAASEKRTREHIDLKIETVNARIDGLDKSLNARIDAVDQKLTARIDGLDKSLNARIDAVHTRIDAVDKSVDGRFDNANGYFDPFGNLDPFWIAMVMIVFLIILPQLIILYKEIRDRKKNWTQIQALREKIEAMSQSMN